MGIQIFPTVPVAQPEAEPWPVDEHTIRIDELFARQLDTEFSAGDRVRIMPGNPNSEYPEQQRPYVLDQNWGGFRNRDGQSIGGPKPGRTPDAHIPYDLYFFWR